MPNDGFLDYIELPDRHSGDQGVLRIGLRLSFIDTGRTMWLRQRGPAGRLQRGRKVVANGGALVVPLPPILNAMEAKVSPAGAEIISRESFEGGPFSFPRPQGNEIAVWTKSSVGAA